jgi:hypothetical protein
MKLMEGRKKALCQPRRLLPAKGSFRRNLESPAIREGNRVDSFPSKGL